MAYLICNTSTTPLINFDLWLRSTDHQNAMSLTLSSILQIFWSFLRGLADSFRGAVDLFLLDYNVSRQKEKKLIQRESRKEQLLNRESPARDIETFAKRRALERRERERSRALIVTPKEEPKILERTMKCCGLNGAVFLCSIVIFDNVIMPSIEGVLYYFFEGSEMADHLWTWTQPLLSLTFSALWVLPFYLLSKVVNAIWFQDIADSAFRSSRGRHQMMSSFSVMIADTVFSVVVEALFLVQGKLCSFLPIPSIGLLINMVHLCLLNSLYCFEYKWFNQGLELHKRLTYIECHWPYFLGFGLPLAIVTSLPETHVISGCLFAILFPLFIVSGNQAHVVTVPEAQDISMHIFHPTIVISNAIFARTLQKHQKPPLIKGHFNGTVR